MVPLEENVGLWDKS